MKKLLTILLCLLGLFDQSFSGRLAAQNTFVKGADVGFLMGQADEARPQGAYHRRADPAEAERHHAPLGAGGQRDGQRPLSWCLLLGAPVSAWRL